MIEGKKIPLSVYRILSRIKGTFNEVWKKFCRLVDSNKVFCSLGNYAPLISMINDYLPYVNTKKLQKEVLGILENMFF